MGEQAKRLRKALGGGMRQVGILGAAGLVSLRDMVGRLEVDHANARIMAGNLMEFSYPNWQSQLHCSYSYVVFLISSFMLCFKFLISNHFDCLTFSEHF